MAVSVAASSAGCTRPVERYGLGASSWLFVLCYAASLIFLWRSPFAPEDYLQKISFITMLWAFSLWICVGHKDLKGCLKDQRLILAIFSMAMLGSTAWYHLIMIPAGGAPTPEYGFDTQNYQYYGMYVAEAWRGGDYEFAAIPMARPAVSYFLAVVYFFFCGDPHLTVMLNGFLLALTGFVVYQSGIRLLGREAGRRGMLLYIAMAEVFLYTALSAKETLIAFLFVYGVYRGFVFVQGNTFWGFIPVGVCTVILALLRYQTAFLLVFSFVVSVVVMRRSSALRHVLMAALGVVALVAALKTDWGFVGALRGAEPVEELASMMDRTASYAEEGTALWRVKQYGGSATSTLFSMLHILAFVFEGSINEIWQFDWWMQEDWYVKFLFFVSALAITILLPAVVASMIRVVREQSGARLYALALFFGLVGLAYWFTEITYARQRLPLLAPYVVLAAHEMERVTQRVRRRLWVLGGILLVGGSLAYEYLLRG
ncbi:MAG: hypothetical protein ACE5JS_08945 [Nitrospinota bacterium]